MDLITHLNDQRLFALIREFFNIGVLDFQKVGLKSGSSAFLKINTGAKTLWKCFKDDFAFNIFIVLSK